MLWNSWLGLKTNNSDEIIINKKQNKSFNDYERMLLKAFKEIYKKLKPNHWMTVTFHSTDVKIFNSIIKTTVYSGFNLKNIVYQPPSTKETFNRTLNPHGTAAGDYYIQFQKPQVLTKLKKKNQLDEQFKRIVVKKVQGIIADRGEPTPYQVILNGIYLELEKYGYLLMANPKDIQQIIQKDENFILIGNEGWWFKNPEDFKINIIPLHERVETAVLQVLRRKINVSFDDILQEIFLTFRNALTPNPPSVKIIVEEYADRIKDGNWKLKSELKMLQNEHSKMIAYLAEIGKKFNFKIWIGKREQSDIFASKPLSNLCDFTNLDLADTTDKIIEDYICQIDIMWIKNKKVEYVFEVEYTTKITEAFSRCSNIPKTYNTKKSIVIPRVRQKLLMRKLKSELINITVKKEKWKIIFFKDLEKFYNENIKKKNLTIDVFEKLLQYPIEKRFVDKKISSFLE